MIRDDSTSAAPRFSLRKYFTISAAAFLLMAPIASPVAGQETAPAKADETAEEGDKTHDMTALYEKLTKQLSGSHWKGRFSIDGKGELAEETYEIVSVAKLPLGDLWRFNARIKYGDHDVTVPLPIKVSWAETTPMIVVDNLTIPGLGTFDARVLISGDRYAGTWQHGKVGGHLFGRIMSGVSQETKAGE